MTEIAFVAQEFQADGRLEPIPYTFRGSPATGWRILRQDRQQLQLGPGYVAVEGRYCGVCSTDLARRHLPFPLPQIAGHEVLAEYRGQAVAVEINASHRARRDHDRDCAWCASGLDRHCPARLTLGIDRLPGGFSPWLLAPQGGLHVLPPGVDGPAATLIEPFAAALRAIEVTRPRAGDAVAVLGPRRLGMLLLAALASERSRRDEDYAITALVRRPEMAEVALRIGADRAALVDEVDEKAFDTVFDTTGSPAGLEMALRLARRAVHIKSTTGEPALGMAHLSEFVIDELALCAMPWTDRGQASLASLPPLGDTPRLLALPSVPATAIARLRGLWPAMACIRETLDEAAGICLREGLHGRFDIVVVNDLAEADRVIRPLAGHAFSLLRPGGCILLSDGATGPLADAVCERGLTVQGSRCGDFVAAISALHEESGLLDRLSSALISHVFPLTRLPAAFAMARSPKAIKVVVDCQT